MSRAPETRVRFRIPFALILALATLASGAASASERCLIFVHGKQEGAASEDWNAARSYWQSSGRDFIETATRGFTTPHYVVSYHGGRPWWHAEAAGEVAREIVAATEGLRDGGGVSSCPSWQSGGSFWVVGHSMGGAVIDYILGNAHPTSENYNANGPYDVASQRISLAVTVAGAHRGSELADAICGQNNLACDIGSSFFQSCDDANFWMRSADSVQVRNFAGPPARSVYLTGGYEAIPGPSICLSGEDDGVIQYASQFACAGSPSAGYDNDDVCGNGSEQEAFGFLNLDAGHENHADASRDTDRDTRRAIADGVWSCGGSPCAPGSEVQSSMSAAQLVSTLVTQGFSLQADSGGSCGLGPGLALLVPLFLRLRRR